MLGQLRDAVQNEHPVARVVARWELFVREAVRRELRLLHIWEDERLNQALVLLRGYERDYWLSPRRAHEIAEARSELRNAIARHRWEYQFW